MFLNRSLLTSLSITVLFLFILSGRFSLERIGIGNFEVRYILFIFFIFTSIFAATIHRFPSLSFSPILLALSFFSFIALFFTIFSSDIDRGVEKYIDIILMLLIVFFMQFAIKTKNDVELFISLFVFAGALYATLVILTLGSGNAGRGGIMVGGPNVATRIIFLGMLSLLYLAYSNKKPLILLLLPLFVLGIIGVGSRGGVVAAALVLSLLVLMFLAELNIKRIYKFFIFKPYYFFLIIIVLYIFSVLLFPMVESVFENRVVNLLIDKIHMAGRDSLYEVSIEYIKEFPIFGLGLGGHASFGMIAYPHNLVLELLLDGGIIFFLFFLLILFYLSRLFWVSSFGCRLLSLSLFYMLMVQMFSGEYYDFRYFFVFGMLIEVLKKIEDKERNEERM